MNAIEIGKYDPSLPLAFWLAALFNANIEELFSPPNLNKWIIFQSKDDSVTSFFQVGVSYPAEGKKMTPSNDYGTPNSGLAENIAGGLCYITLIPAIIFLVLEPYKSNRFIRFNAFQSIFLFIFSIIIQFLHIIPVLGTILAFVLGLAVLVVWIIALVQAFMGKKFVIPVIGGFAEQAANS